MLADTGLILGGFLLLFFGADRLIHGSVRLSLRLGITPLVIGLTVVAFGTSTPELFVSLRANLGGNGDIALGNIIGSNIFNIAVILGLAGLIHPITIASQLIRQDIPVMIAATILFVVVSMGLVIERPEGAVLFALLLVYIAITVRVAKEDCEPELTDEITHHLPARNGRVAGDIGWIVAGIALLVAGSNLLIEGAVSLAQAAGVSEAVIGLTLIAAGTGLPELATSIMAALKKESDLAVGNIVGSNIFNLLCIGGVSSLVRPLRFPAIEAIDLYVMLGLAVALLPLCWTRMRIGRRESALLLASYGFYLYYIWPTMS